MTLKDLMASDMDDVFLNTDDFGETATYFPKGGGSRQVVICLGADEKRRNDSQQYHLVETNVMTVLVKNSEIDGITNPQLGDYLVYLERRWDFESSRPLGQHSFEVTFRSDKIQRSGRRGNLGL